MNLDPTQAKLDQLLDEGLTLLDNKQCDAGKIVATAEREFRIVVENGEFTLAQLTNEQNIGVLVHKNNKKGSASLNSPDTQELKNAINEASSLASFSLEDPHLILASNEEAPKAPKLNFLCDTDFYDVDVNIIETAAKKALKILSSDKRLCIDRFEIGVGGALHNLANTNGVRQQELQTTIDWSYLGMARDGDQVSGMDYDSGFSFSLKDFEDKLLGDIESYKQRLLDSLKLVKTPTYTGKVLLSPRALDDLILGTMLYHSSGRKIMDGKSRWADSLNDSVCSDLLTITDDPHSSSMSGSTSYDSDGIPTFKKVMIENGVLKTHLFDCYSANKLGKKANASSGGPFGLKVSAGTTPLSDLFASQSEVVFVERFSGNLDPLTGDFSGVAKNSCLYSDGNRLGSIGETMIAGNSFDLMKQILNISQETQLVDDCLVAPTILVDGISVSSAE